uniref:Uncharacterized protein n=1 Tax=Caenorhabditis tropicalis TaxID=1561998 RepID=A0A1I7TGZ3_9PELO
MEFDASSKSQDGSPANNNSFTNSAFVNSGEDISGKRIDTSSSQPQLAGKHPFQHHVLDDVIEDDESDENQLTIRKKTSVLEPAITLVERFNEIAEEVEVKKKEEEEKKLEDTKEEEEEEKKEEPVVSRPSRTTRPFFIGVVRSESEDQSHPHLRPPTKFE